MSKLKDFDIHGIMQALREFSYTKTEDGQVVDVNVEFFPTSLLDMVTLGFNSEFGSLKAEDLYMTGYKGGALTSAHIAAMIRERNKARWKYMLEVQYADFNPLWNVDGKEIRVVETEYGKKTTHHMGSSSTTEQLDAAEATTEQLDAGESTTEQLDAGESTTEQIDDGTQITEQVIDGTTTSEHSVAPENSQTYNPESKDVVTTDQGKTTVTTDAGKVRTTTDAGKIKTITDAGKIKTVTDAGKVKTTNEGEDYDKESDSDTVTDTFTRGGNIGVTKSTELLSDTVDFWKHFDFFHEWYHSIAEVICIPVYEED